MLHCAGDHSVWSSDAFWLGREVLWRTSPSLKSVVSCQQREAAGCPVVMLTSAAFISTGVRTSAPQHMV